MYEDDIFIRLVEEVESQGGELLPATHSPQTLTYKTPQPDGRIKTSHIAGIGCGFEALLSVPYDRYEVDKKGNDVGLPTLASVEVCAVDDCVHAWPRFCSVLP